MKKQVFETSWAPKSRMFAPGHPQTSDPARSTALDASNSIFQLPGPEKAKKREFLELELDIDWILDTIARCLQILDK